MVGGECPRADLEDLFLKGACTVQVPLGPHYYGQVRSRGLQVWVVCGECPRADLMRWLPKWKMVVVVVVVEQLPLLDPHRELLHLVQQLPNPT